MFCDSCQMECCMATYTCGKTLCSDCLKLPARQKSKKPSRPSMWLSWTIKNPGESIKFTIYVLKALFKAFRR